MIAAWTTAWWQDPLFNWSRPNFVYNGYFFNMGAWVEYVPGAINPTGNLLAEPPLMAAMVYVWMPLMMTFFCAYVMRKAKAKWPSLSVGQLMLVGLGAMMVCDLIIECFWVHTRSYSYVSTIHALTLWAGEIYQFPIYESLFWGGVWACSGILYYFRDDRGHTVIDRGIDQIKSTKMQVLYRFLAMVGYINIVFACYNIIMILIGFSADPAPEGYPSWLLTGQCGAGTHYECPGPNVHVPLPESGPNPPFTGRN